MVPGFRPQADPPRRRVLVRPHTNTVCVWACAQKLSINNSAVIILLSVVVMPLAGAHNYHFNSSINRVCPFRVLEFLLLRQYLLT